MINPEEKDIGREVEYVRGGRGIITSFNDRFVFVRYHNQHPESGGQATSRIDLKWISMSEEQQNNLFDDLRKVFGI